MPTPPTKLASKAAEELLHLRGRVALGIHRDVRHLDVGGLGAELLAGAASVASVIGQTSPQLLKPKASSTTLPRNRAIENGLPSEPASANSGAGITGDSVPALKRSLGGESRGGSAARRERRA